MPINVDLSTITASGDGKYYEANPAGDAPVTGGNAALGWSAPTGLSQGSAISLTTDGTNPFGSGPTNVKYDNFESGTAGSDVTTLNSEYDSVSTLYPAKFRADSRSGSLSITGCDENNTPAINTIDFTSTREVFLTYATKIPTGSYFPGSTTNNIPSDFYSSDSSWKIAWLQDGDGATNDLVVPSHIGGGNWLIGGNGLSNKLGTGDLGGTKPSWFGFNNWTRIAAFIKAGATPETDAGTVYFQAVTDGQTLFEASDTPVIFSGNNAVSPYHWTKLNITGFSSAGSNPVQMLYDDLYVAWGANAAARVELGDNAIYSSCTNLHIQNVDPLDWATGQIDWNIDYGPFSTSQDLWIHATLADNVTRYTLQVVSA